MTFRLTFSDDDGTNPDRLLFSARVQRLDEHEQRLSLTALAPATTVDVVLQDHGGTRYHGTLIPVTPHLRESSNLTSPLKVAFAPLDPKTTLPYPGFQGIPIARWAHAIANRIADEYSGTPLALRTKGSEDRNMVLFAALSAAFLRSPDLMVPLIGTEVIESTYFDKLD